MASLMEKLGATVREQFKKKLAERLEALHVPASGLHGSGDRCKVKLRASGYRLVYQVRDDGLVVVVIAVGKRERSAVYTKAGKRKGGPALPWAGDAEGRARRREAGAGSEPLTELRGARGA